MAIDGEGEIIEDEENSYLFIFRKVKMMDPQCAPMLPGCQTVLPTWKQRDEKTAVTVVTAA